MQKRLIQSITRATDILGLFNDESGPLGITEIAGRLELSKTTVAGLVSTLQAVGYLEKDPFSGKYRLGPEIFRLGVRYAANIDVITLGRAWIERLCFQFRQPVNVGMLVGDKVFLMFRKEPDDNYMTFPQAGAVLPAHSTCIGKAIFAYMDADKRSRILKDYEFERLTANTISDMPTYLQELEKVRESRISFDNEETLIGLCGIGGPIFNHQGTVIAGFVISGDPAIIRDNRNSMIEAVHFTSQQVSRQLGYRG